MMPRKQRSSVRPETRAGRNIRWIETYCRVPDGRNVGKPLIVADFMRDDLRAIYDNSAGTRRAILSRGRKNAKTTQAAMILLLHLCGPEAVPNSQLYSTAQSLEQAAIVWRLAAKMVRLNAELDAVISIKHSAKELHCPQLGTVYKALSAEKKTAYGLSPALIVHDELGQVRGPRSELYEAMETATAAHENPMSIIISTQAPSEADLLSVLIDDAKAGHDPRTVLRLHTAPIELDAFSIEAVKAANPAFEIFMNAGEVLAMVEEARRMPARQAEYENLILNRRVEARAPFVKMQEWTACNSTAAEFDPTLPVYGGLDLSEVRDLTAFVLIGRIDGIWHVRPTFWLPDEGLAEKSRADRVPYDLWRDQGYLLTAPGKSVDYEYVAEYLRAQFDRYAIQKIGFDRWNMRHLKPWLEKAGFSPGDIEQHFAEFGQGTQSMSPALRDLETEIANARLAHGAHPVLTMCAAAAVVDGKDSANRRLSKSRSSGRIDGMVALAMAFGMACQSPPVEISSLVA